MSTYWTSIDKLAKSFGFALISKTGETHQFQRTGASGNTEHLFISRARPPVDGRAQIQISIIVDIRRIREIESDVFHTHSQNMDASSEEWRLDGNMRRGNGTAIAQKDAETSPGWTQFKDVLEKMVLMFDQAPTIEDLLAHLVAGPIPLDDPRNVWPWTPNGSRFVLYLLALGRIEEARSWARKVIEGPANYPDDELVSRVGDRQKEWARTLMQDNVQI